MYREIYIHVFAIVNQPTYSILASVLCSKMKQYCLKFHASGQRWIRVEPRGMVQPIPAAVLETTQEHNWSRSHVIRMCSSQCTMVRPITVAMTKKMVAPSTIRFSACFSPVDLDVMKEYEIITLIYNRKSCRLDLLSF